jgi:hypothetical protein
VTANHNMPVFDDVLTVCLIFSITAFKLRVLHVPNVRNLILCLLRSFVSVLFKL